MNEVDILDRKIVELRECQSHAWRQVADPLLTAFERREIRNRIKASEGELRHYLQMKSDRLRFEARTLKPYTSSPAKPAFRLLA